LTVFGDHISSCNTTFGGIQPPGALSLGPICVLRQNRYRGVKRDSRAPKDRYLPFIYQVSLVGVRTRWPPLIFFALGYSGNGAVAPLVILFWPQTPFQSASAFIATTERMSGRRKSPMPGKPLGDRKFLHSINPNQKNPFRAPACG